MRERFKKNRKENNQEDQISELTLNFHGALSILTFSKMSSPYSPRKAKRKKREKKRENRGETRRKKRKKKKREKLLFEPPH